MPPALDILFEDNHLLVIDKPAGLLAQAARPGDDSVVARAASYLKAAHGKPGNVFVGLVHRLDRMTSGVMVLARTSKAAGRLSDQIRERLFDKRYLAIVHGRPAAEARLEHTLVEVGDGVAIVHAGAAAGATGATGKRALLAYRLLAAGAGPPEAAALEVSLTTGRKHQIRAQLAAAGHPLFGDSRYGRAVPLGDQLIARPALHAWRLAFVHPVRREPLAFEARIPEDLQRLVERLGLAW